MSDALELYYRQKHGCKMHREGVGKICLECVQEALTEADARVAAFRKLAEHEIIKFAVDESSAIAHPHIRTEEEVQEDKYWRRATNRIIELAAENIRRIPIPASDAALKFVVAQAVVEEAEWWARNKKLSENENYRLTAAQAELAAAKRDLEGKK